MSLLVGSLNGHTVHPHGRVCPRALGMVRPMGVVRITEFTDPTCPWAWSAEPFRRRLRWLYGDALDWDVRMVVLSPTADRPPHRGMTPRSLVTAYRRIAQEHGMPIDTRPRRRLVASLPACRAVVAVRVHAPEAVQRVLRELRVRHFCGDLVDEPAVIAAAASAAGLDPARVRSWMAQERVGAELAEDMRLAREPMPAARMLDARLANWSGGRRYTCPSYEITRSSDGVRVAVPGFQPFAVYDVITANLVPGTGRRTPPESVTAALRWADCPLATQEVAVLCELSHADAREELGRVADERCLGADGLWTLR
jgi:predicted DsbA family dithiol-disulfide isomerase